MKPAIEELENEFRFRKILTLSYTDLVPFILGHLKQKTPVTLFFWTFCLVTLGMAVTMRINIAGYYELSAIFLHSLLGLIVLPIVVIPVHEGSHLIPYIFAGARGIRAGVDLRQFIIYVTAHRYVTSSRLFRFVAAFPFIIVTVATLILIWIIPGLWKYSLALFLFVHTTMCAGDFAMISFCHLHRKKPVYTWDDADIKEAYFYEEI